MRPYKVESKVSVYCNGIYKIIPLELTVLADSEEEAVKKFNKDVRVNAEAQSALKI